MPRSAFRRWKISITSTLVALSRLPVGSSASRIGGSFTARGRSRRAAAVRPTAGSGWCSARSSRPTAASAAMRPLAPLGRRHAAAVRVEQRQLDVLERRGARQQVEALEHEPDLRVADARQLVVRQLRHVAAVQQIAAARRPIQAAEDVHERRLARARRPDDGHELAGGDVERDAAEGVHRRPRRRGTSWPGREREISAIEPQSCVCARRRPILPAKL